MYSSVKNSLVVKTKRSQWVIPNHCEFLKLLIKQESISPEDLSFSSALERQQFAKELFLLAVQDEFLNSKPSSIAGLGRALL